MEKSWNKYFIKNKINLEFTWCVILGEKFIGKNNVAMILGDNFFYGQGLSDSLKRCVKLGSGAKVFLHKVTNPQLFGVARINKNKILKIIEKPKKLFH